MGARGRSHATARVSPASDRRDRDQRVTLDEPVRRVADLDRAECRRVFDHRFTAAQMADDYVRVYERVISSSRRRAA